MPSARPALAALAALLASGCTYVERRDTIAASAGDAMAANRAIHMVDPWPAYAADTRIAHDAERAARAVERYRTRDPEKQEKVSTGVKLN